MTQNGAIADAPHKASDRQELFVQVLQLTEANVPKAFSLDITPDDLTEPVTVRLRRRNIAGAKIPNAIGFVGGAKAAVEESKLRMVIEPGEGVAGLRVTAFKKVWVMCDTANAEFECIVTV